MKLLYLFLHSISQLCFTVMVEERDGSAITLYCYMCLHYSYQEVKKKKESKFKRKKSYASWVVLLTRYSCFNVTTGMNWLNN